MFNWQPVFLSIKIACMAVFVVGILGTLTAHFLVRRQFPGKDVLEAIITLPLVLPPVVTGFMLLILIGRYGPIGRLLDRMFQTQLIFTPTAAVIAAITVSFPLMYQSTKAAFQGIDRRLEEAARTLGASELKIFFTVTLPLAWPGLVAGLVLAFSRALGEFGATAMIAGNIPGKTQTIPVAIFFASENNDLTTGGLYVLVISLITFALIFWVNHWSRKRTHRYSERKVSNAKRIDSKTITGVQSED